MAAPANNPNSLSVGGTSIPSTVPAAVTAVLAIVFMFLPWVHVPIAGMANSAMAFTGNGLNISSDYTILGLNDLINTLMAITPNSADAEREIAPLRTYIFFWGASIVVLIAGIVVNLMGKKWLIIIGSALTAIAAAIWCGIIMYVQNEIGQAANGMQIFTLPMWPYATILASVGTIILAATLQPSGTPSVARSGRAPSSRSVAQPVVSPVTPPAMNTTRVAQPVTPPAAQPVTPPATTPVSYPPTATTPVSYPPTATAPVTQPVTPGPGTVDASCYCPNCGALVQVAVPNSNCLVNITCGGCGEKFPMEVRPRS